MLDVYGEMILDSVFKILIDCERTVLVETSLDFLQRLIDWADQMFSSKSQPESQNGYDRIGDHGAGHNYIGRILNSRNYMEAIEAMMAKNQPIIRSAAERFYDMNLAQHCK